MRDGTPTPCAARITYNPGGLTVLTPTPSKGLCGYLGIRHGAE